MAAFRRKTNRGESGDYRASELHGSVAQGMRITLPRLVARRRRVTFRVFLLTETKLQHTPPFRRRECLSKVSRPSLFACFLRFVFSFRGKVLIVGGLPRRL